MRRIIFFLACSAFQPLLFAQNSSDDAAILRSLFTQALEKQQSYEWLRELCAIGPRFAGSPQASEAVEWGFETMSKMDFDTVYLQEVSVPHWVRGMESAVWRGGRNRGNWPLAVTALGGSVSTPSQGIRAQVVEVKDYDMLDSLGKLGQLEGKIVFYNYPMKQHFIKTFHAYGDAVKYRWLGAARASEYGAVASVIRSLTHRTDDFPHTGSMTYQDAEVKIPAGALSTIAADKLSEMLIENPTGELELTLLSEDLGRAVSYNVIAEKYGTTFPEEILLMGGHLDSWDLAEGAHDDGAGCVHAMGAAQLLFEKNLALKRTLRVVLYMNEEFGLDGARMYAEATKDQRHVVAIESDAGGYIPRGFSFDTDSVNLLKIQALQPLFVPYGLFEFIPGGSGADVGQIRGKNMVLGGLRPESQRYFDVHHAATDVFEAVHPRELEIGTAAMAALIYLLDKYDIPEAAQK
jgi:carboxypeptidase Q